MSPPTTPSGAGLKVGVDLRYITTGASGGVAPQITETFRALIASAPDWRFHVFGTMYNQDLVPPSENVTHYTLPLDTFYVAMQQVLDAENVDVLYRPFPNDDQLTFPLAKQIVFIPDLQHEFFPDFFDKDTLALRREHFGRLISAAGAVATNTDHARETIKARYRNAFDDIILMPPASQVAELGTDPDVSSDFQDMVADFAPFFFFPANIWPHKNHGTLLDAFDRFRRSASRHSDYNLVLTGHPRGWDELREKHPSENVRHLGFVSRNELVYLYRHAKALTFPSLFEGFGMPVLEAFGAGCPVIASSAASLPEVAQDAALLCDPSDAGAIADAMGRIADSTDLAASLIAKGHGRMSAYSWASSAENLKSAMLRVAARPLSEKRKAAAPKPAADMDTSVKVTIVTPSYNQGRFLKRTIESVLNQTYPNIEYIVMDGGSKDESVDILKSYGDRFRWVSEKDKGQTDAINKGLRQATGQILAYLNSDDTLELDAVETVVKFFRENQDIDLVYGDANYIDEDDEITGRYLTAAYSWDRLVQDCCVCQPAAFWRSSVVERFGLFDDELDYVMDYEYWLRIGQGGGGIRHLPVLLANSRLYPETKTMSARGLIYREIFEVSNKHAGRVSKSYVQGYWNHRLWERQDLFAKVSRRIPMLEKVFVEYHAARVEETHYPPFKAMRHVVYRTGRSIRARVRSRLRQSPMLAPLGSGVAGVYKDNWLSPYIRLSASPERARTLFLEGRAPKDTVLRVKSGKELLAEYELPANVIQRIEIPGTSRPMEFHFNTYIHDKAGRHLSFHVKATDCFTEEEV
jgi:glycosyltransferase involved in cell wall biosynthesis